MANVNYGRRDTKTRKVFRLLRNTRTLKSYTEVNILARLIHPKSCSNILNRCKPISTIYDYWILRINN